MDRDAQDARALGRLGYAQALLRRMGGFSSFAVSFSIISVLTGCVASYADAIGPGGPAALGIGWPLVSLGTIVVALAMAELASAFPTAGALYHWSAILGGPSWGWLTAATNIVGQLAIVAAIDLGCASELSATLGLPPRAVFVVLLLVLASHAILNATSLRIVAWLNDASAIVHIVGVAIIAAALAWFGRSRPLGFFFETGFTTRPDGNASLGFVNGLVLSMFTFTGYDASAHLAEETHDPARRVPRGIVTSVAVSSLAGYVLLAAITLAIRDLPAIAGDSHAALSVMRGALGDGAGRAAMALAIMAMWFCGLASVTSASRTVFAFARDRGLPFSAILQRVRANARTPAAATLVVTAVPFLIVVALSPLSSAVFDATVKMATMGLYVSYGLPITLGAIARARGAWKTMGPFQLGLFGRPLAWIAALYCLFVLVVCSLPPNQLAAKVLLATLVVLGIAALALRGRFAGPKVDLARFEAHE